MQLFYGVPEDIDKWMNIVTRIRWNFPGLETQEKLDEHRATVLRFMGKRQSICVKEENEIAGVMPVSYTHLRRYSGCLLFDTQAVRKTPGSNTKQSAEKGSS